MKQDVRLYLSGNRADLSSDPRILFNYKVTDTQNPAAVKNNFSRQITLEGTDRNNEIFGEIYDLSRLQTYGAGDYFGTDFNPLKKAEFLLYIDSELYETGYFKLNEITKTNKKITYSITLYGGLGEFIYNLSESEGGNKMEFKDLKITPDKDDPYTIDDLGFEVSKETINEAWDNIYSNSSKYSTLNFVPCYNGTPDDFDADKVLINFVGKHNRMGNLTGITTYQSWATGEHYRDLTEWETRDLRSYLQRPALRVRTLINTVCNPDNNGGYEVELSDRFFNYDNPYYDSTFITLPMIKDLNGADEEGEAETISGATVERENSMYYNVDTDVADFSDFSNLDMSLKINAATSTTTTYSNLYTSCEFSVDNTFTLQSQFVKKYFRYYSSILLQLVALDELGQVVASSAAYQLTTRLNGTNVDLSSKMDSKTIGIPEWKTIYGYFKLIDGAYTWVDMSGNPVLINFKFPSSTSFHKLKLRVQRPYVQENKFTGLGGWIKSTYSSGSGRLWPSPSRKINGNHNVSWYLQQAVGADIAFSVDNFTVTATRYGGFQSGQWVSHDRILTLGITPADFLLSYCKLFGLHIWAHPTEKKIYIADRGVYYNNEIVDLNELIDRSAEMKITPQVAQSKWYDFNTEQNESQANNQYREEYGTDFGLQRVNTSYDFDAGIKEVYDGEFKGAVQVLENGPYYYNDYDLWPVYFYNGFTLTTYSLSGTAIVGNERTVNTQNETNIYPLNDKYPGFDLFDKPQFHTEGNSPSDGALSLVFYTGEQPCTSTTAGGIFYWLTDDIEQMVSLNSKTPCWIVTESATDAAGNTIAIRRDTLPRFSRYRIYPDNGYITHTLDFGRTQETYIPDTILTSGSSIYEKCWKNYIADMYDVNNRVLTCKCLLRGQGQVNPNWLRRFYWFDQSVWRLNAIKEWSPGEYSTTTCEFLKVIDPGDYELERITTDPIMDFYLTDYAPVETTETDFTRNRYYTIGASVSAVSVAIEIQDGGLWYYGDGPGADYSVSYENGSNYYYPYTSITASGEDRGYGSRMETFNIGTNNSGYARTFRFNIVIYGSSGDYWRTIYLTQTPEDLGTITITRFGGSGNVPAGGGTVLLTVSSQTAWNLELPYSAYTSIDKYYGQAGSHTVVMTVSENTGDTRPIALSGTNIGGSTASFSMLQNAAGDTGITEFNFSAETFTFESATGGTINGRVDAPSSITEWTVTTIPNWITMTPDSGGSGSTNVVLTADANTDTESRFGAVTVSGGGEYSTIHFGQPGVPAAGIVITLESDSFPGTGGTIHGSVYSSVDGWYFQGSTWLTPSIEGGNRGTTPFDLTAEVNSTGYGRIGYFHALGPGYNTSVTITQDA